MNEAIVFLSAPFAMCLILGGIHCYLGLHVLKRGVIFVDLSLAQVSSLGATIALLWDPEHGSAWAYWISLSCTLAAAIIFAQARRAQRVISQEAVIGITYALASAAVVLVVDRLAHGAEHLKDALVGQILWVTWKDVFVTAAIYIAVGTIHWIFRKPLLKASDPDIQTHFKWDLLFYALFGFVITSSTHTAGVLQVFSYLIVPAVLANIFFHSLKSQLVFGWTLSALISAVGLFLSVQFDLPVGALIVVLLTVLPLVYVVFSPVFKRP